MATNPGVASGPAEFLILGCGRSPYLVVAPSDALDEAFSMPRLPDIARAMPTMPAMFRTAVRKLLRIKGLRASDVLRESVVAGAEAA